ncbi:MAG TPA: cytochrome c peroxidase [Kofleriaceae bacterium]|nr:cytochrome c peroxidase [Kofleriaceae bacterium]
MIRRALLLAVLAGCPHHERTIEPQKRDAGSHLLPPDDALVALPPAPPLPAVPEGLPPIDIPPAITPNAVALGELLFAEPRLASDGKTTCASCHDPAHGFAGGRLPTATGQPNLRAAQPLVDLAWATSFGWDGRYATLAEQLGAHVRGQLGRDLADGVAALGSSPVYRAQFARAGGATPDTALAALSAYVLTRYAGAAWDALERATPPPELDAGYKLFTGKAQCAVCHPPPLYTDLGFHRLGLIALHDEGRGRVDPAQAGAFATPTLRGAAARPSFFHDASARSLDAAIDWHLAGGTGQGADPSIIDPALRRVALSPIERAQLGAFVRALAAR